MKAAVIVSCLSLVAIDGDTIKCDGVSMRLIGDSVPILPGLDPADVRIDAAEIRGALCDPERDLGIKAKRRLEALLSDTDVTVFDTGERDRIQRPLVRVMLSNGRTAGSVLFEEALASRRMVGRKIDWCSILSNKKSLGFNRNQSRCGSHHGSQSQCFFKAPKGTRL